MTLAFVLPLMAALAVPGATGEGWTEVVRADGVTVLTRPRQGSGVGEVKATGLIDAPPEAVWRILWDHENYHRTMPYIEESRVLAREEGGRVVYFYSVLAAPFISRRDYVLKVVDESRWQGGRGYLKLRWTVAEGWLPEREGIVRLRVNEGTWLLEPRDGGTRTFATYVLFTDPGGALPRFVVNRANTSAVPDVFRALRRQVAQR